MGGIFSKKTPKNSKDILEDLEKQIKSKTSSRKRNQQYERSFVSYLLLLSFSVYLLGVAAWYLYFRPSNWIDWLIFIAPLICFPIIVYLVKKLLNMYFSHRKAIFDQELASLYEEKRRVLNEVMEKETYNTAVEILQRYDPTHPSLQRAAPAPDPQANTCTPAPRRSEVRHRPGQHTPHPALLHKHTTTTPSAPIAVRPSEQPPAPTADPPATTPAVPRPQFVTPSRPVEMAAAPRGPVVTTAQGESSNQPFIPPGMCLGAPPGPPTPVPILPRDRSSVDKVVEYLVGDGPNNRYALICQKCHSHNGMALRDEFEYTTFRCAYCFHLNPSRKKKPSLSLPPHPPKVLDPVPESSTDGAQESSEATENAQPKKHVRRRKKESSEDTASENSVS